MAISNGVNNSEPKKGSFLFTSESVGEGHPDKIWYGFRAHHVADVRLTPLQ